MPAQEDAGFRATWEKIPYMTRHLGAAAIALFFVYVVNPFFAAAWFWQLPGARWWYVLPYATAPLSYSGKNFNGLITLFMFCSSLQRLELGPLTRRSDVAGYFLFVAAFFNVVGPRLGMYAFLSGISSALSWTVAQEAPWQPTMLIVVQVSQCYVPWANVLIGFVVGGVRGTYEPLLGIVVAHAYMFFTELLPRAGGPKLLRRKPRFLQWFDGLEENERKAQAFGRGRKLGKHR